MEALKERQEKKDVDVEDIEQYVTFTIGEETYGVEVLRVQEIMGITGITYIPNSLPFMKGVINLRGAVVPVLDMRLKLKMNEKEYDASTVILIVEVKQRLIGMIADAVSDVVSIPHANIQETPHFSSDIETDYIKNIARLNDDLIIVLDVDMVLTQEEINRMRNNAAA